MTTDDHAFAAVRPAWDAWILANEERSIRDYLAAVDEGTPDTRVYFRGYYHGVRSRFGLSVIGPVQQGIKRAQEGHESATVRERLQARGDEDEFFAEFVRGMMGAMDADNPPVS